MDQGLTVRVERESDVVLACQKGRGLAARLGFGPGDQVAISIAISEVARNIIVHAGRGHMAFYSAEANGRGRPCKPVLNSAKHRTTVYAAIENNAE